MKQFLNQYMAANRRLQRQSRGELESLFQETTDLINEGLGRHAFRPRRPLNAAVCDAVMVGIARRLQKGRITDTATLGAHHEALIGDDEFIGATETGTADEKSVSTRLQLATQAFSDAD